MLYEVILKIEDPSGWVSYNETEVAKTRLEALESCIRKHNRNAAFEYFINEKPTVKDKKNIPDEFLGCAYSTLTKSYKGWVWKAEC